MEGETRRTHHESRISSPRLSRLNISSRSLNLAEEISDTFRCPICLESRLIADDGTFVVRNCKHPYCKVCIASFIIHKIINGDVYPECFIQTGVDHDHREQICSTSIHESDIHSLLQGDDELLLKYYRFKMMKENSNIRFCSKCDVPQTGSPANPSMKCSNCGHQYCFMHGDAHSASVMCVDYELEIAEESGKTKDLLSHITKPCPNCKSPIEKSGGCNQMKCYHCNTHFCWLCGKKVDDGTFPAHFEWWNVTGCPNRQMEEHRGNERSRTRRICVRIISLLQVFFLGPPALVLTFASSVVCCCFLPMLDEPPAQIFGDCMTIWGYILMAVFLCPFVITFGTPCVIVYGMYWCATVGYGRLIDYIASLKPSPQPARPCTPVASTVHIPRFYSDNSADLEAQMDAHSI